jgi:two-component system osmolarity sensor histidine kinase EnvZ
MIKTDQQKWLHTSKKVLPKGLYTRSLLIVIIPMIVLQSVVAFLFLERHWQLVTEKLSSSVSQDIAALVALHKALPEAEHPFLQKVAAERLGLTISLLPYDQLPAVGPKPWFGLLERTLAKAVSQRIDTPFWIDSIGDTPFVEIRVRLKDAVMRVVVRKSQVYASNWHIFIVWMIGASVLLITVAILFLRNQIKPIQQLAHAAEAFGKGRDVPDFRPRGAREIRQASLAFLDMKSRIERQIEQRTTMLAGVSHDLRTVLTRFRLELAMMDAQDGLDDLRRDVDEMERMLAGYLEFARGAGNEAARRVNLTELFDEVAQGGVRSGHAVTTGFNGDPYAMVRPDILKRALDNLVNNASRFARNIHLEGHHYAGEVVLWVDDDGPGIPEDKREDVFKPFVRLDEARNLDHAGSGLGLVIARDAARAHGGDIYLMGSPLGGLRVEIRLPV